MALLILLIIIEVLTINVIRQHFYDRSWMSYYFIMTVNAMISIWLWVLWIKIISFGGIYDQPENISAVTSFYGMMSAVVLPRTIMILFHFSGIFIRRKSEGGHSRILTNTGMIIAALMFVVIATGSFFGRFNFSTEYQDVKIKGLKKDLDGLRIVQISDIHITSFYHQQQKLEEVMKKVNELNPDILVNTGDFVTIGWREFGRSDTILSLASGRYGEFAVMGNHDFGTYHPHFTQAEKENNIRILNGLISSSGYKVLNDEFAMVNIGNARIAMIGVKTKGSFPHIIHGDLKKATERIYGADLRILLAHDPNQWDDEVAGKTDIDLTLSGHTHGMQIGILTKWIKWSPAVFFYPRWNGLYSEGNQYLVVNRGLGVLGMPFRIWMPPEITVITLKNDPE
jgi:predicted MPP superfamily phosphohydrolase